MFCHRIQLFSGLNCSLAMEPLQRRDVGIVHGRGSSTAQFGIAMCLVTFFLLFNRLYYRVKAVMILGPDDYMITFAWVSDN